MIRLRIENNQVVTALRESHAMSLREAGLLVGKLGIGITHNIRGLYQEYIIYRR